MGRSGAAISVTHTPHSGPDPYLVLEQQGQALKELVGINGGEGNVEEEAIEHRLGDPLQWDRQQQEREAHQDAGTQGGQPCLLHVHDPAWSQSTGSPPALVHRATPTWGQALFPG